MATEYFSFSLLFLKFSLFIHYFASGSGFSVCVSVGLCVFLCVCVRLCYLQVTVFVQFGRNFDRMYISSFLRYAIFIILFKRKKTFKGFHALLFRVRGLLCRIIISVRYWCNCPTMIILSLPGCCFLPLLRLLYPFFGK